MLGKGFAALFMSIFGYASAPRPCPLVESAGLVLLLCLRICGRLSKRSGTCLPREERGLAGSRQGGWGLRDARRAKLGRMG